ncbi:MAG: ABC transporter permease [Candidatus Pacebacteria bacterium]|jgi:NitT/TauT family transport system permease protein|nr:ABC transporter permease [Candidatus Paceibacterota bacterium]
MFKIAKNFVFVIVAALIWQLSVFLFKIPNYLLPAPADIIVSFSKNYLIIIENAFITLGEVLIGFFLANLISLIIVCLIFYNKKIEKIILPASITIKTIPIIAITPIIILWFGTGFFSKVVVVMAICFFPSLINMIRATKSINSDLFHIFTIYSATKKQTITKLIIPSTLPYLFSSLKISSSLAVVGAIVGEFVAVNKGLGFLIMSNYYSLNMSMVFTTTLIVCLVGLLMYYCIDVIEKRLIDERY